MPFMGVVRAEGNAASSVLGTDLVVIQRQVSPNTYYSPLEATVSQISASTLGGFTFVGAGVATLVAGTATVALPAVTANSKIQLTEASATPNALGYTITAGTGFTITSASGTDTSRVSWMVIN